MANNFNQLPHGVDPSAHSLAQFIDAAHAQGYGDLDPNILSAVAANGTSHPLVKPVLDTIKNAAASAFKSAGTFFSDPSLVKPPTDSEKIAHTFSNTGIAKVAEPNVKVIQQRIISKGYVQNLPVDGVWNSNWNDAVHTMILDEKKKLPAGDFSARKVFHTIFDPMLLSHAIPLVTAMGKSVVSGAIHAAAGIAQPIVDTVTGAEFDPSQAGKVSLGDKIGAAIESAARIVEHQKKQTAEEYLNTPVGIADYVNVVGTYFLASSLVRAAATSAYAVRGAITAGKVAGATSTAGALVTDLGQASTTPAHRWLLNSLFPDTLNGAKRFAFTKSLQNKTSWGAVAGLNKVATKTFDGWVGLRNALATPYRLPIVGVVGKIGGNILPTTALKGELIGQGEKFLGDPNGDQAQAVDHITPIAGMVGAGLNLFQLGLHAPHYDAFSKPSVQVGQKVETARTNLVQALRQNSVIADWERGTKMSYKDTAEKLVAKGISKESLDASIYDNLNQFAARHAAQSAYESRVRAGLLDGADADVRAEFLQSAAHMIINDPVKLQEARVSYTLKPGLFVSDLNKSIVSMKSDKTYHYSNDFISKLGVDEIMRTKVIPHIVGLTKDTRQGLEASWNSSIVGDKNDPWNLQIVHNEDTPIPNGSVGYMKTERQTVGDAQNQAYSFYQELGKVKKGFVAPKDVASQADKRIAGTPAKDLPKSFDPSSASEGELALREQVLQYLGEELNRNVKDLLYVPTKNLIDLIVEKSHSLAADLHLPEDASPVLVSAQQELDKMGYKLVIGTDIGHAYSGTPIPLDKLGAAQNRLSRYADKIGAHFSQVHPDIAGEHSYSQMLNTVQDEILKNPTQYPVWATAGRLVNYLQTIIKPDMNLFISAEFAGASSRASRLVRPIKGGMWEKEISSIMAEKNVTRAAAKAQIQDAINTDVGPQYWTKKDVIKALTEKGNEQGLVKNKFDSEVEPPAMSIKAANDFYYAMQKGLRSAPAYVQGLNPFNKMLDSTFGLGNLSIGLNGRHLLDLKGNLRHQLLNFRYQGSYRFAYLRAVKAALKGVTEDIPFTLDAHGALAALGPKEEAFAYALRDNLLGADLERKQVVDTITQEFAKNDIFNVYNPRAIEARDLYYLYKAQLEAVNGDVSLVDKKVLLKKLDNIYSYGSRTAAEKSVNAFFFPFSFEKTIVRQLGGHLLDNAGARMMTSAAISLYDSSDGQKVKKWVDDNLPIISELEKFNPFYHGSGVGQFGGIQRLPYDVLSQVAKDAYKQVFVNTLSPQPITGMDHAKAVLALIPALRDLNNILVGADFYGNKPTQLGGSLLASANTLKWEAQNIYNHLTNNVDTSAWATQSHLPYNAQQNAGWAKRSQLLVQFAQILDANRKGQSYMWPSSIPRVHGQKITSGTIGDLVNHIYPKWDQAQLASAAAVKLAVTSKEREIISQVSPHLIGSYDTFIKLSNQINGLISKDSLDTQKLSEITSYMRQFAINLSTQDKSFYAFYKRYYELRYGPLERM